MIAEHHLTKEDLGKASHLARTLSYTAYLSPAISTPAGGSSAGVGCFVKSHICTSPIDASIWEQLALGDDLSSRLAGFHLRMKGVTVTFLVTYLFHSEGLTERNLQLLHALALLSAIVAGPIVLVGDFNLTLEQLDEANFCTLAWGNQHV